jgi:hypothetical protein
MSNDKKKKLKFKPGGDKPAIPKMTYSQLIEEVRKRFGAQDLYIKSTREKEIAQHKELDKTLSEMDLENHKQKKAITRLYFIMSMVIGCYGVLLVYLWLKIIEVL